MRLLITGSRHLEQLEPIEVNQPDPELVRAVNSAMQKLPIRLRYIVIDKFYRGMTISQIAQCHGINRRRAEADIYEAKRLLRYHLADFVRDRWDIKVSGICKLCTYPKSGTIERMLKGKKDSESWGSFGKRLSKVIGERINPPRVLIAHLKHSGNIHKERANG
jgi:hypothetical protein